MSIIKALFIPAVIAFAANADAQTFTYDFVTTHILLRNSGVGRKIYARSRAYSAQIKIITKVASRQKNIKK